MNRARLAGHFHGDLLGIDRQRGAGHRSISAKIMKVL
jgi:hypothetical protein